MVREVVLISRSIYVTAFSVRATWESPYHGRRELDLDREDLAGLAWEVGSPSLSARTCHYHHQHSLLKSALNSSPRWAAGSWERRCLIYKLYPTYFSPISHLYPTYIPPISHLYWGTGAGRRCSSTRDVTVQSKYHEVHE
jgi:hypothetical protein